MDQAHPYISGSGSLSAAISQFRKSFPPKVNAETLQKFGIAPNNESYLINVLRFLGTIDEEGGRTEKAKEVFSKHEDTDFQTAFEELVKSSYQELFELHGDETWQLPINSLISFFRTADKTSDLVGKRQASTFQTLASFAGHGEPPPARQPGKAKGPRLRASQATPPQPSKAAPQSGADYSATHSIGAAHAVGLSVRIEVNLPAAGDQETYDRIFRSIRENLLNAK